jgi:small subunit ribosomal protein S21
MLIIKVKKGENIDIALKRYKFKYRRTKVSENLRANKEFIKPSVKKRKQKQKAIYITRKNLTD